MNSSREMPSKRLTPEQLVERLTLSSPDLVEELYKASKDYLASEAVREGGLNAKATSLLTASGLSLTVAFTFGGLLLQHPEYLDPLKGYWPYYVVPALYCVALLLGLAASGCSVWALFVRGDYLGVSEEDVFNPGVLAEADRLDVASLPLPAKIKETTSSPAVQQESQTSSVWRILALILPDPTRQRTFQGETVPAAMDSQGLADDPPTELVPPFPKTGTAYYRRYMTAHLWQISQTHFDIHESKAKRIRLGQGLFVFFLLTLAVIGIILAAVALLQQQGRTTP